MSYSVIQTQTNNVSPGLSLPITVTSTTGGNFLIVSVYTNTVANTLSITDSAGSTWNSTTSNNTSSNLCQTFYITNCSSGITSVTVHQTVSSASMVAIFREYSTSPNMTNVDVQHSALSSANPATSGATGTLASTNDLVIGVGSCERSRANTFSIGAGYSNFSTNTVNFGGGGFTGDIMIEDKAPGSTSAQTATFGNSNTSSTLVFCLTFKPSSSTTVIYRRSLMGVGI